MKLTLKQNGFNLKLSRRFVYTKAHVNDNPATRFYFSFMPANEG